MSEQAIIWAIFRPQTEGTSNILPVAMEGTEVINTVSVLIPRGISMVSVTWAGDAQAVIQIRDAGNQIVRTVNIPAAPYSTQRTAVTEVSAEVVGHRISVYVTGASAKDVQRARLGMKIIPTL